MATNLVIDDQLIIEAQAIGGAPTKKAAVTEALKEYIQRRKQIEITSLFGKVDYDRDYDYDAAYLSPAESLRATLAPLSQPSTAPSSTCSSTPARTTTTS